MPALLPLKRDPPVIAAARQQLQDLNDWHIPLAHQGVTDTIFRGHRVLQVDMPNAILELFVCVCQRLREESERVMHVPEHAHLRMVNCLYHIEQVLQAREVTVRFEQDLHACSFRVVGKCKQTCDYLFDDLLSRLDVWNAISE